MEKKKRLAPGNDLHVCRLKVTPGGGLVGGPDFITSSSARSLIRIPAGQRRRTSSSSAKGAHLSERPGDHRPTNLPRLADCQALCRRIKDKRTEAGERARERAGAAILFRDGLLFNPPPPHTLPSERALSESAY